MSKCLVTKLKAVVDNPDLPILGEVRLHLRRVLTEDFIVLGAAKSDSPIIATILGDNEVVFSENNSKTLTITSIDKRVKYKGGNIGDNFYMRVVSKYDMSNWSMLNNGGEYSNVVTPVFPAGTLKYHNNVIKIGEDQAGIRIDISELIASGNVINTISNGGTCRIRGNYEEFLSTIWNNGRTSKNLLINRTYEIGWFPTAPAELILGEKTGAYVTFTDDSIVVTFWNKPFPDGTTGTKLATATYNGSTWSYQMGS